MILSRTRVAVLAAAALLAVSACGDDTDDSGTTTEEASAGAAAPVVVATTSIWGDVVGNVACDGAAEVRVIVPPGADPHSFEPSLRDRELLDGAALVVANGADLEESLVDVLTTVADEGVPVFEMTNSMQLLEGGEHSEDEAHADEDEAHADEDEAHSEDDDHGGVDPHVWQDPTRVLAALPALAEALVGAGLDPATVDACLEEYTGELEQLDADVEALFADIPTERRVLVTNHDSLAYLADRYGFEILGTVIPAPTTLAETNPADLEDLATVVAETGVPAIFAEEQHSSTDAEALAERVGDVAVVQLFTDSLGPDGSGAETYSGLVRTNAEAIAGALAP